MAIKKGTSFAETIIGTAGADRIFGLGGNDTLLGDAGNDKLYGGAGNDKLFGGKGHDLLDGGIGHDTMTGGFGNDTYAVDHIGDVTVEKAGQGTDTVLAKISHTLSANVENLTLTGSAAINGTGNGLSNVLIGNGADNVLDGGAGADVMIGGAGNDTYVADNAGDVISDASGIDTVLSPVSFALASNLENLILIGGAAINGVGNGLNNVLSGNGADNVLDGGAGADVLIGGDGNDTYVVDNAGDSISDTSGTDTVQSSISITLASGIENLVLIGSAAINGTGNTSANTLIGNGAANTLAGGAGNDTILGGAGADQLFGNGGDDILRPGADTNADFVDGGTGINTADYSDFTTGVTVAFSNLGIGTTVGTGGDTLQNIFNVIGGSGNDDLQPAFGLAYGGAGDDTLRGFAGLFGGSSVLRGGLGHDTLIGSAATTQYFQLELNQGADVVANFETGIDRLRLDHTEFNLPEADLLNFQVRNLASGAAIANTNLLGQFIFVQNTFGLYFDQDGTDPGFAPVLIATLTGFASVASSDFDIV